MRADQTVNVQGIHIQQSGPDDEKQQPSEGFGLLGRRRQPQLLSELHFAADYHRHHPGLHVHRFRQNQRRNHEQGLKFDQHDAQLQRYLQRTNAGMFSRQDPALR